MCKPKKIPLYLYILCAKSLLCVQNDAKRNFSTLRRSREKSPGILCVVCMLCNAKKRFHDIIIEQFKCNASHLTLYGKRNVITMHT